MVLYHTVIQVDLRKLLPYSACWNVITAAHQHVLLMSEGVTIT